VSAGIEGLMKGENVFLVRGERAVGERIVGGGKIRSGYELGLGITS
jgi:hypothetical protein